jgi:hypothetical protein
MKESDSCYVHALFELEEVDRFMYGRIPQVCRSDEVLQGAKGLSGYVSTRLNGIREKPPTGGMKSGKLPEARVYDSK